MLASPTPTTRPRSTSSPRSPRTWRSQYSSTGSGTGKKEFGAGLTDFAGTDSTVKDGDGPAAGSFFYIPTVAAPITVSYNLAGVDKLQLSGPVLAKIFPRTIKTWNDPAIAADNPGVTLPDKPITVVHRSDGSGTTNNFTKYLVKVGGADWTLGSGDTVAWAADTQAGDKNTGVAQLIKQSRRRDRLRRLRRRQGQRPQVRRDQEQGRQVRRRLARGRHGRAGRCHASRTT